VDARGLEQRRGALNVRAGVGHGRFHGRPDACLGRQVDHARHAIGREGRVQRLRVADVALDERETIAREQPGDIAALDGRVVVRVEVVDADDALAARDQRLGQV